MLEIGLFHNGASSLPVITTKDGVTFNDGSLPEVHRAAQETLVNQVRQGILAEIPVLRPRPTEHALRPWELRIGCAADHFDSLVASHRSSHQRGGCITSVSIMHTRSHRTFEEAS